jgi:hypothetical protein
MKKALILAPIMASILAGCGTFSSKDPYERRVDEAVKRQEKIVDRSLSQAPKWMTELPQSNSAVYAAGTAVSADFSMSEDKAKAIALGKICIAAGGTVDKQTKVFIMDTATGSSESSEMAIRSKCNDVDVTGAVIHDIKRVPENGRYRTYVLVALPSGEANQLRRDKLVEQQSRTAETRSREAFKEMSR